MNSATTTFVFKFLCGLASSLLWNIEIRSGIGNPILEF